MINIGTRQDGQTLMVSLQGRLDTVTAPRVSEALEEPLANCASCTLDMASLDYVSSAGLRLLLLLHKRMAASGGRLLLLHVQPGVRDILEMTGFTSFLSMEE